MAYDPGQHHRRSIRLKDYDYGTPGFYFVTICTHNRECTLGRIDSGGVELNWLGRIVQSEWANLSSRFPAVTLDSIVVMPNHVHMILTIVDPVGAQFIAPRPDLGEIVRSIKAVTTRLIRAQGSTGFRWQRNYYEHVVRNEQELNAIRQYILDNPLSWDQDPDNLGA
jgi:REP element-mobilizing transposase RayT